MVSEADKVVNSLAFDTGFNIRIVKPVDPLKNFVAYIHTWPNGRMVTELDYAIDWISGSILDRVKHDVSNYCFTYSLHIFEYLYV